MSNTSINFVLLTGADIQSIPAHRVWGAGWDSYALAWNLLGNPLQNSSLLTGLNSEAQLSLKMLVFGMNITFSLVDSITSCHSGKLACTRQPKVFRGKNGLRVGPCHKVTVGVVGPDMRGVIFNSSYMTLVWQVSCQLGMRKRCYCMRVQVSANTFTFSALQSW